MLYKSDEYLSGREAAGLQKQNSEREQPYAFTLWGEQKNQKLSGLYGRVTQDASVLFICGSSALLFPQDPVLMEEDQEHCLLSEDLAYELFGSTQVVGQSIRYQEREYRISGLLGQAEDTVVIQGEQQEDSVFFAVALKVPKGQTRTLAAEEFQQFAGVMDRELDLDAVASFGRLLVGILPVVLLAVLWYEWGYGVKKLWHTPVKCLVWSGGAMILLLVGFLLINLKTGLTFPFIPSQWSDFSYWSEAFETCEKWMEDLIAMEKRAPERMIIEQVLEIGRYGFFSILILPWIIKKSVLRSGGEVLFYSVVSVCGAFFAALLAAKGSGQSISGGSALWIFPSYFFLARFLLKYFRDCL